MVVAPPFSTDRRQPATDLRLEPTPACGTLGPGSEIAGLDLERPATARSRLRFAPLVAAMVGTLAPLIVGTLTNAHPIRPGAVPRHRAQPAAARDSGQLDGIEPQKQAETLLELALAHSDGAVEQISSRVDRWRGKVEWSPEIAALSAAALNSNDMRVRDSGVEVELAAYGLSRNSASVEYLLNSVESSDQRQKIWALWALGLMANRGVEAGRITGRLAGHLKDSDEELRRWAVEGLAVSGADEAMAALLATMHDDPSPLVRERAACSLAESGMFTPQQRMRAVPQLLAYTDDPALDHQTQGWAFQVLGDITGQRLARDPGAWRSWYERQVAAGH